MSGKMLDSLKDISSVQVSDSRFLSASHEEIDNGWTTDIYFVKTRDVLKNHGSFNSIVTAEFFARDEGVFAGASEVMHLLRDRNLRIEALPEGTSFKGKDVVMRISGPYPQFGMYETVMLGMLASATGWATAAKECVEAAGAKPVICFGARHVHPAVAPVMERAAVKFGGCSAASCIMGAKMAGMNPKGTIPHAAILIAGDTVELARVYDKFLPPGEPRIVLVDTFRDEAEESLRVAEALKDNLHGVRLDTPGERGGVTPELVREVRWRLDKAGYPGVQIIVSGGLHPEKIRLLSEAGADSFGVGSYIANATPRNMTMDIKVVEGKAIAKRGRLPGIIENSSLVDLTGKDFR